VLVAIYSKSLSDRFVSTYVISFFINPILASLSGNPMYMRLVNLLNAASSRSKGLFVAAITRIPDEEDPTPSS
jgi:hypothetical protein